MANLRGAGSDNQTPDHNPNRVNELPERTKEFLSKLGEDDINNLEDAMKFLCHCPHHGSCDQMAPYYYSGNES